MELFSACCVKGRWLLEDDHHKQIVTDCLHFMVHHRRIRLFGFVVLPSEIQLLWQKLPAWKDRNVGQILLKFTAQQFKRRLKTVDRQVLDTFKSSRTDRQFQFWERGHTGALIESEAVVAEKLQQMHEAPVVAGFCGDESDYAFSSAAFYSGTERGSSQKAEAGLLTHYKQYFIR